MIGFFAMISGYIDIRLIRNLIFPTGLLTIAILEMIVSAKEIKRTKSNIEIFSLILLTVGATLALIITLLASQTIWVMLF